MAENQPQQPPQAIQAPPGAVKRAGSGPLIFTMPERYRGGAAKMAQPKPEAPKPAPTPVAPPAQPVKPPAPKPVPPGAPKKKKSATKLIVLVGLLFVVGLGAGGFFLLKSVNPTPTTTGTNSQPGTKPVTTTNPPVTNPPVENPPVENPPTENPFPTTRTPGKDTDSDGLTDTEEQLLYSTDPLRPDSDSDGFLDGNEVFHHYNPNGVAPGTLLESGLVKAFEATFAGGAYSILYPSVWRATVDAATPSDASFTTTTGEVMALAVKQPKSADQTLQVWYDSQGLKDKVVAGTTKNGYPSLVAENQLAAYVDGGTFVIALTYNAGIKGTIEYLQTFQMMLNSIVVNP